MVGRVSAFADLLVEARDRLRVRYRTTVALHFDWDGDGGPEAWKAWYGATSASGARSYVVAGSTGEEALRRLVDRIRAEDSP